ncbi:MAG: class I SAM-dependent methyltransferase [Acidobacteria bacterium]|nr:class I SAM-dependent methyltransferase [Acidobacteriota bacterium]
MKQKLKSILRGTHLYKKFGRYVHDARNRFFDLKHGVSTANTVGLHELDIENRNVIFAIRYECSDPKLFHEIFDSLKIKHEDFAFVDFGSGKGRALLFASEYPFKKVVGVEFSPQLHRIAQDNIRKYKSASQKCKKVESICMDVINYDIQDEPAVLFLYNPFKEEILSPLLAKIENSIEVHPREILIVYVNPELEHIFEKSKMLIKIESGTWHSIYKNV